MRRQSWWHVVSANSKADSEAFTVLLVLSLHANQYGYAGLPLKDLALFAHCTVKVVRSSLLRLIAIHELRRVDRGIGRSHAVYRILVAAVHEVNRKRYRVKVLTIEPTPEFPPLRVLEAEN